MQSYTAGSSNSCAWRAGRACRSRHALHIVCGGPAGIPMVRDRLPKILGSGRQRLAFPSAGVAKGQCRFFPAGRGRCRGRDADAEGRRWAMLADAIAAGLSDADIAAVSRAGLPRVPDLPPLRFTGAEVLLPDGFAREALSLADGRIAGGGGARDRPDRLAVSFRHRRPARRRVRAPHGGRGGARWIRPRPGCRGSTPNVARCYHPACLAQFCS